MGRLNRGQRIAVLAGLAFALYVFGHFLIDLLFSPGGFVVYAPISDTVSWNFIWHDMVQLGVWIILAAVWTFIAVRSLRNALAADAGDPDQASKALDS